MIRKTVFQRGYAMYTTANKKMLNMIILQILENYSDEEHHLTQQEIMRILYRDYGMECDRRSVKNNVEYLIELGYDIDMEDGYFLASRQFEDAELRMLIDSVLFSKTLSSTQAKKLIKKLEGFGNKYFKSKVSHVATAPNLRRTENKQVLYTVNDINDAMDKKKKISFRYSKYENDMKLHDQGRTYIVNPYQMIAANGYYYLLGNLDKYDDVSYYRIDKISDVEILDEKIKPMKDVKGLERGLDLPKHMAEHIYMFCGESIQVKLKCEPYITDALVDWFGKDIHFIEKKPDYNVISVWCNHNAMVCWAIQYGTSVEVLEPAPLREEIKKEVAKIARKYK